jgi:hypothetical protein
MKHEKIIKHCQALARGFLARLKIFKALYKKISTFELNQMQRLFKVEVFKL